MRIAVVSDIHIDLNGPATLEALAARVREVSPEVPIIGGDVATGATTWLGTMLTLRPLVPHLLAVAGNHDVWSGVEAQARGIDAWKWLDTLLPALAGEAGVRLLDVAPLVIDGIGFAGTMGWFDLSTRDPELEAPEEAYRTGSYGGLRWNDHTYARWGMPVEDVAARLRDRLRVQLESLDAERIVVSTHFLPFAEQVAKRSSPGWRFINAFMGCLPLGEVIRNDPRVVLATAGHTHVGSDRVIGGVRALVSPLGYRKEWGTPVEEAVRRAVTLVEI